MKKQFFLMSLMLVALAGCGGGSDDAVKLVPAGGPITLDGKPLPYAQVAFFPLPRGPQSVAQSNEAGGYKLFGPGGGEGAMPGKHRVTVQGGGSGEGGFVGSSPNPTDAANQKAPTLDESAKVPEIYGDVTTTPLVVTVPPEGSTNIKLELSSSAK